jgi:hypothetical protein
MICSHHVYGNRPRKPWIKIYFELAGKEVQAQEQAFALVASKIFRALRKRDAAREVAKTLTREGMIKGTTSS